MRVWLLFAAILGMSAGCDLLFQINATAEPKPEAQPTDGLLPDAPSILKCSGGRIVLRPTTTIASAWEVQFPAGSIHVEDVAQEAPDEDTTYIASKRDGAYDLFGHLPVSDATTIDSVVIWARARVDQTTSLPEVGVTLASGSATSWDDQAVATSYGDHSSRVFALDPSTGVPWTVSGVNSMTFGVRKSYADMTARVTQVWAVVACH